MARSPYRSAALTLPRARRPRANDRDLVPMLVFLWLTSATRVVTALTCHEKFGVEPTVALIAFLFLPWALASALHLVPSKLKGS